jgi:flagellar biosynthetic protein FlhB
MAENKSAGEKTEKATPGKLKKAREKGEIPRSKDMTMAVGIVVSFMTVSGFFPYYKRLIQESFISVSMLNIHDSGVIGLFMMQNVTILLKFIATLLPIPIACLVASLVPGGWLFSPNRLIPDLKKLNPITGLGRLVSASHLTEVAKMLAKCAIILYLLYSLIGGAISEMMQLQEMLLPEAISVGLNNYRSIIISFVVVIAMFAVIDVPLSKFLFNKKMKMTKQEVKEEYKNNEGKPEVKGRIRQLQRQFAMGQINQSVPTADVVITNPTHYAVALKYDPLKAGAPFVVAKGADEVAFYIRQVAQKNNIEVVEIPPLTRAIYHTTKINQQIPSQLYKAIAYVLTYVLQLKSWRTGQADKPVLNKKISIPKEVLQQYDAQ